MREPQAKMSVRPLGEFLLAVALLGVLLIVPAATTNDAEVPDLAGRWRSKSCAAVHDSMAVTPPSSPPRHAIPRIRVRESICHSQHVSPWWKWQLIVMPSVR